MPARTEHSVAFQVPEALNASPLCENCLMRRWLSRGSQCGSSLLSLDFSPFENTTDEYFRGRARLSYAEPAPTGTR